MAVSMNMSFLWNADDVTCSADTYRYSTAYGLTFQNSAMV